MQARIYVYGYLKKVVPLEFRQSPYMLEFESPIAVYKILTDTLNRKKLDDTVMVNGKIVNTEYVVKDGDDIHIYPPIAGG
jgi:molybdopterin converting factor small subunit